MSPVEPSPIDLSIVVPAHNEASSLPSLIDEIERALDSRIEYELIIVDDGSTDDTLKVLSESLSSHEVLRVLRHCERRGQSAALHTGFKAARADWVATLDGDGQNDPADIPALLNRRDTTERAADLKMVAGIRSRRRDGRAKRLSSRLANALRQAILKDGIPDTGCGLKLISREAYLALPRFDHMHRFLPALIQRDGGRMETVEVGHRPRTRGRSKYGIHNRLWVGLVDLLGVWWLRRRSRRTDVEEIEREKRK